MIAHLLTELLFLTAMAQLGLCLYQHICGTVKRVRAWNGAAFVALLLLCSHTSAAGDGPDAALKLPWGGLLALSVLILAHVVRGLHRAYRESRETLTPASVKQALDNLNSGILFADDTGRAVLVNRSMGRLAHTLVGSYPQMAAELEDALVSPPTQVERLEGAPNLYRFPDGRVWRFQTVPLTDTELTGFSQTSAQDMTELVEANARLERDNEALRAANLKMREMIDRISDRVREEETLSLKMKIHNDIGTSLIALTEQLDRGTFTDVDAQLKKLGFAVGVFVDYDPEPPAALEEVRRQADELNIRLVIDGPIPVRRTAQGLVVAAIRECITNCARHARGSEVTVSITLRGGLYIVTITNDGTPPDGPIVEGGGLSSLRKSVERAGGEMTLTHAPRFALLLHLPEKEEE